MLFNIMKLNYFIILITLVNFIKISNADDPIKCFICKSADDPKCTQAQTGDGLLKLCEGKPEGCHTTIDESGKTVRGCGACPTETNCKASKAQENKEFFPEDRSTCPQCTNCEKVTTEDTKPCAVYKSDKLGCYIGTDEKSKIIRGCESDKSDECDKGKIKCNTCTKADCEKTITLPKAKCITCMDDKECKRPTDLPEGKCSVKIKTTPDCSTNEDGKTCFTNVGPDNTVKRGCATQAPTDNSKGKLTFCSGDECNSDCIHDINCAQCTEEKNADCKDTKQEWYQNKCSPFTTVCHTCKNTGGKVERGCGKTDLKDCVYNYNDLFSPFSCYRCRSDMPNQQFCAENKIEEAKLKPTQCTNNPNADGKKCYIDNYDGIVIRGCISDIVQPEVKNRCTVDGKGKYCTVCDNANCNNGKVPNSSHYLHVSFGILLVGCLILLIS